MCWLRRVLGSRPYVPNVPSALVRRNTTYGARGVVVGANGRHGWGVVRSIPGLTPEEQQALFAMERELQRLKERRRDA